MKLVITGIEDALGRLEKVRNIEKPVLEALGELMEEARAIVEIKYSLQRNGNTNYNVSLEEVPNGYVLTASGDDIGFLEFGAGVFTETDEFASEVPYPVTPGSWSESHPHSDNPNARYFAKNGFWWWSNIRYTGLSPTRGMQSALDHIRNNLEERITRKIEAWIDE